MMDKLKAVRKHLETWLDRAKDVHDAVPHVKSALEQVQWQENALADRPAEAGPVPEDVVGEINLLHEEVTNSLPQLPERQPFAISSISLISTSVSSAVYASLIRYEVGDSPKIQAYVDSHTKAYVRLQDEQRRAEVARQRAARLSEPLGVQFDRASAAVRASQAGVGEYANAALELRTLLDNLKGVLFARARKSDRENITWARMACVLLSQPGQAVARREVEIQEQIRGELIDELSGIAKRREPKGSDNLSALWIRAVDHVYVVTGAVLDAA